MGAILAIFAAGRDRHRPGPGVEQIARNLGRYDLLGQLRRLHRSAERIGDRGRRVIVLAEQVERRAAVGRIGQGRAADDRAVGAAHRVHRAGEIVVDAIVGVALEIVGAAILIVGAPLPRTAKLAVEPTDEAIGFAAHRRHRRPRIVADAAELEAGDVVGVHRRRHRCRQIRIVALDRDGAEIAVLRAELMRMDVGVGSFDISRDIVGDVVIGVRHRRVTAHRRCDREEFEEGVARIAAADLVDAGAVEGAVIMLVGAGAVT